MKKVYPKNLTYYYFYVNVPSCVLLNNGGKNGRNIVFHHGNDGYGSDHCFYPSQEGEKMTQHCVTENICFCMHRKECLAKTTERVELLKIFTEAVLADTYLNLHNIAILAEGTAISCPTLIVHTAEEARTKKRDMAV